MRHFVIDDEPRIVRRTQNFKRFRSDLENIGAFKYDKLDAYSENYFIRKIKLFNDESSLEELLKAHIAFIIVVARQMCTPFLSADDLTNEGCWGFIRAAQRFDSTRGFKFLSYAVWYIRGRILATIAEENNLIRLPLNFSGNRIKVYRAIEELNQEYCFDFSNRYEHIAEKAELPTGCVVDVMTLPNKNNIISFEDTYESYTSNDSLYVTRLTVEDVVEFDEIEYCSCDDGLNLESLRYEIMRALRTLTERESDIINLFFGLGLPFKAPEGCYLDSRCDGITLEEIGEAFGLTRERVRQIKEKATRRLRHTSRSKLLRGYLG